MKNELERIWKETAIAQQRYNPSIYLEGVVKTTKKINWGSLVPGLTLNDVEY
jgi:hypothetical protein